MGTLKGLRILIVEDETLIALTVADMLASSEALIVGPATTIEQAYELASSAAIDVATLDVNVRGTRIDPVADILERRGIPYLLATGYVEAPLQLRASARILNKPYVEEALIGALLSLLSEKDDKAQNNSLETKHSFSSR